MDGRTPHQVFKAGLTDARKAARAEKEDADKKARPRRRSGEGRASDHYHPLYARADDPQRRRSLGL